jgi:hypothetical protein
MSVNKIAMDARFPEFGSDQVVDLGDLSTEHLAFNPGW